MPYRKSVVLHCNHLIIPTYINKFAKQFFKDGTQTRKIFWRFNQQKRFQTLYQFTKLWHFGTKHKLQNYYGKSKEDTSPTVIVPEDITYA